MALDPYSPCPCGSNKKLKFCCPDLVHDLEKVHRMLEGDQPRAALSHLDKMLAKSDRPGPLLEMKSTIELTMEDFDAAQDTVDKLIELEPQNSSGYAQRAILIATQQGGKAGALALQQALELLEDEMPPRVLQAIGSVGQALLIEGNLIAARAHLWLYQGISGKEDSRAMELLMRLNQSAGLPLLLRDHAYLRELELGHAAETQHDHAQILASRGQWNRAAEQLADLCEQYPDEPALAFNCGIVNGWLGKIDEFIAGLRRFAELSFENPKSTDDAIEAEAIAQLLDKNDSSETTKVVRAEYGVSDEESLIDQLTRDKRTVAHQLDATELAAIDGPPPRQTWLLLDKPLPESGVDIQPEQIPEMLGFISYYGRQTDREERLELVAERGTQPEDGSLEKAKAVLTEISGSALGSAGEETITGESAATDAALNTRWHFPVDTLPSRRLELLKAERSRVLLEKWPVTPRPSLGGITPKEAAEKPELKRLLAATLLILQQSAAGVDAEIFSELRTLLGVDQPNDINPQEVEIDLIPLARAYRITVDQLSDDQIVQLYERATMAGANEVLQSLAKVAIDRDSLSERIPRDELYYRLISLERDLEVSMKWIAKAKQEADDAGKSNATWDILELELCVLHGQSEEANQLVQHIRNEHLNEPGVAEQLYQLLYSLGAIPQAGAAPAGSMPPAAMPASPEAVAAPSAAEGSSKIWTPGDDSGAGGDKKIWTPG